MKQAEIRAADLHEKWMKSEPEYARAPALMTPSNIQRNSW
jgi:hypothetical protein